MSYYYYDYTYFIYLLPALIVSMIAQFRVQSAFRRYSEVRNGRNLTGAEA
ncbi:MAG TPA: peptidase, partial [Ruminococcaceae bacterium]|nr:peptidase [Oscillospiraceae bacterium]